MRKVSRREAKGMIFCKMVSNWCRRTNVLAENNVYPLTSKLFAEINDGLKIPGSQ